MKEALCGFSRKVCNSVTCLLLLQLLARWALQARQGREAHTIVEVYVANLRLQDVETDALITAYETVIINPMSESATTVGACLARPATQSGCMPMAEVFKLAVSSFKVNE